MLKRQLIDLIDFLFDSLVWNNGFFSVCTDQASGALQEGSQKQAISISIWLVVSNTFYFHNILINIWDNYPSLWRTPSFLKMGTLHHQPAMAVSRIGNHLEEIPSAPKLGQATNTQLQAPVIGKSMARLDDMKQKVGGLILDYIRWY